MGLRHGHAAGGGSPTYKSWRAMKRRCTDPEHERYPYYGGRGIGYAAEWEAFDNFLRDVGERPPGTTLDRLDTEGHYVPGNVRWATREQQNEPRIEVDWEEAGW